MIEIENLCKSYSQKARPALQGVSLTIGTGVFGLLGPNGAGKTTLMSILATLIRPTSGAVRIMGHDSVRERGLIRRHIGFLPQEFGFYRTFTAYEILSYFASLSGLRMQKEARINEVLALVNLTDVAHKKVGTFSGGMRQRLGIAQALLNRPSLLIIDEPTSGLDPSERIRIRTLLVELGQYSTVIMSTHIVSDISTTCSRVAVLKGGQVLFDGTTHALAALAEGKVWVSTTQPDTIFDTGPEYVVAATMAVGDALEVRVVGQAAPGHAGWQAVPPTGEDGYLALVTMERR